jgi:hypothetical protein
MEKSFIVFDELGCGNNAMAGSKRCQYRFAHMLIVIPALSLP